MNNSVAEWELLQFIADLVEHCTLKVTADIVIQIYNNPIFILVFQFT